MEVGLSSYLPRFYSSSENNTYPCILKPASGEFGANTTIVNCSAATRNIVGNDPDFEKHWVLQEFIETAARVPPHHVGIRQWRVDACGVAGDGSGEQAVEVAKQFHR